MSGKLQKPYMGLMPYIFVSYSHAPKSSKPSKDFVKHLQNDGYRVWYDEGITPSDEYWETIAGRIMNSTVVLCLVTKDWVESSFCDKEVKYAVNKGKTIIQVYLEDVKQTPGQEMALGNYQWVSLSNYTNKNDFYEKIYSCRQMDLCKMDPTEEEAPEPFLQNQDILSHQNSVWNQEDSSSKKKKKKRKPDKSNIKVKQKRQSDKKIRMNPIPIIIALILLVGCSLFLYVGIYSNVTINGEKIKRNVNIVTLKEQTVNVSTMQKLKKLKKLVTIHFNDCTFDNNSYNELRNMDNIADLSFEDCKNISDYQFLNDMEKLKYLSAINSGVTDLNFKLNKSLISINLSQNPEFSDLSILDMTEMKKLILDDTGVSDLSNVSNAINLTDISACRTNVNDISPLMGLEKLTSITFNDCSISDKNWKNTDQTFKSLSIKSIELANNRDIHNLACFDNLTVLKSANFAGLQMDIPSCLTKSADSLNELNLSNNTKLSSSDYENELAKFTHLQKLNLSNTLIKTVDFLTQMKELKTLNLSNCKLASLPSFEGLKELDDIYMAHNPLNENAGSAETNFNDNSYVDLSDSELDSIMLKYPTEVDTIFLYHTNIDSKEDISNTLNGRRIVLDYFEGIEDCNLDFTYVCILDCPDDQKIYLQDEFSGTSLKFVTEEEIQEYKKEAK